MKKIIIALAAVISTMIFIASPLFYKPLKAYADYNFANLSNPLEDILDEYESENTKPNNFYTKETLSNSLYYDITADTYVLYFKTRNDHSAGHDIATYNHSVLFRFDSGDIVFSNGVLSGENLVNGEWVYSEHYCNDYSDTFVRSFRINRIEIDFVNKTFHAYDYQTNEEISNIDSFMNSRPCTDIWDIQSNIPVILNSGELNVFVSFSPTLSGNVDRSINNNGVVSMRSQLYMQVVNQSRFPIQYKMAIYKKHQQSTRNYDLTTSDNVFYDNDPIFVYYGDSWVYCTNCDDENTFLNADTVKENKSSPWHYVDSSSQDIVTFDFNQINMLEGEEYTVYVYAVRNDFGYASEQIVYMASSDPALSELKQIQGDDIETVYQSDFVMINYNDVKYDPNNSNNGVKPFNGRDGFAATQQYSYSRNARENQDGSIDYSSRNLYTNQNSWLSQQRSNALANHSTYSSGRVPASLSTHFNNFLSFITAVFGRMPTDIQSLYIYGFIALVVLGIVLKVVK